MARVAEEGETTMPLTLVEGEATVAWAKKFAEAPPFSSHEAEMVEALSA